MKRKIELLAPAGDLDKLKIAIAYGADAVYLAGKSFGLRAKAGNFNNDELVYGRKYTLEKGKRMYITLNVFPKNSLIDELIEYLKFLNDIKPDALIIADPGVIYLAKKYTENIEIHISTQANTQNWASCKFWMEQGASRIVLGREVPLKEIKDIHKKVDVELEAFVHGAMCMSYSGRCMISMHMTGKSANEGACTHPCRWKYHLVENERPGELYPVEEDDEGTYIFNSKDLCMIEHLVEIIDSGINSLKIEGRMKSIHYVASTIKTYRRAIDLILDKGNYREVLPELITELYGVGERDFTTAFYLEEKDADMMQKSSRSKAKNIKFVGRVLSCKENGYIKIEQRNKFNVGDILSVLVPLGKDMEITIKNLYNSNFEEVTSAPHPKEILYFKTDLKIPIDSLLRQRS